MTNKSDGRDPPEDTKQIYPEIVVLDKKLILIYTDMYTLIPSNFLCEVLLILIENWGHSFRTMNIFIMIHTFIT